MPLIGFALAGDQFDNLLKARERGFGIIFTRDEFTADVLLAAVQEVWSNPSCVDNRAPQPLFDPPRRYEAHAQTVSAAIRDTPRTPTQQAADWVEYAARHNGATFNVLPTFGMPWWRRANVDVYAVLAGVVLLTAYALLWRLPRWIWRRVTHGPRPKTD